MRIEALWEFSQTRALRRQRQMNLVAIREGRIMPVESSQATAAAAVSAGKRDANLEQESPDAQACAASVRVATRGYGKQKR